MGFENIVRNEMNPHLILPKFVLGNNTIEFLVEEYDPSSSRSAVLLDWPGRIPKMRNGRSGRWGDWKPCAFSSLRTARLLVPTSVNSMDNR